MKDKLQFDIFIQGKNIDLFVLTEEHALYTDWYSWFNDAETMLHTEHHRYTNTPNKQVCFYKNELENTTRKLQLGIMDKAGKFFGITSLSNIDHISQKAELAVIIGDKTYRTGAYSAEAAYLMLNHAFNALNLQRIEAGALQKWIADFWVRMLNFTHEGILRRYIYKNGTFCDCHIISLLREEFKPISFG